MLGEAQPFLQVLNLLLSLLDLGLVFVDLLAVGLHLEMRSLIIPFRFVPVPLMVILFFFVTLDQLHCLFLPVRYRLVIILLRNQSFRVLVLLFPQEMLLRLDPVLDGLADEGVGRCAFDVLNTEIAIVLLVLGWRIGLFWALVIDDLLLGNNRTVSYSLEVLLMRGQKGIVSLRHFGGVKRESSVIEC